MDTNNNYFRNIFNKENIDLNGDIMSIFNSMPIITKREIKDNFDIYISKTNEKIIQQLTSGTNGEPLKCLKSNSERSIAAISQWKERRRWDPYVTMENFFSLTGNGSKNYIGDFTNFDNSNMRHCFDKLMSFSPRWLWTSVSVIEKYAQAIERGEIDYNNKSIKYIELAGEYVEQSQRRYIENIFGCKTINHYGTRECWCIAYECPQGELHVLNNLLYVESINNTNLNADLPQGFGEITITSLYNKVMPLIRYNLEDLGKISSLDCACGKKTQIIQALSGRKADIIKGTKGVVGDIFFKRIVHSLIWKNMDYIDSFKVDQLENNYFVFYIVKKNKFSDLVLQIIQKEVSESLGKNCKIDFRFVDNILLSASGKSKIFSCLKN
ncbi:hypothetical protein [Psychrobacillus sp. L4]|uniref:hypothetical protein n=1 Tax=Psychrobacillus sp. L4 TaxID=3236892 RepID=UPI0036F352AE